MSGPASTKALSQYSKADPTEADRTAVIAEMNADNDRAFIILTATYTETILTRVLKAQMPNLDAATEKELFETERPLGTFSAKIRLGYALGLYGSITKGHMDRVRLMRNACAHARKPISFAVAELQAVAKVLPRLPPEVEALAPNERQELRTRFHTFLVNFENALLTGRPQP